MQEESSARNGRPSKIRKLLIGAGIAIVAIVLISTADKTNYRYQVRVQTEVCIDRQVSGDMGPVPSAPLAIRQDYREKSLQLCYQLALDIVDGQRDRATLWHRGLGVFNGMMFMDSRYRESKDEWADRMRRKWDEAVSGND